MGISLEPTWQFVGASSGGEFVVEDLNVWLYDWQNTGKSVVIRDPLHQQPFVFHIWKIHDHQLDKTVEFVADEFSNNVWGFYVLK